MDPDGLVGLALLAHDLNRDLQRAARAMGGHAELVRASPGRVAAVLGCDPQVIRAARDRGRVAEARARCIEGGVAVAGRESMPRRLGEVFDPPCALFAEGPWAATGALLDERPVVAIVGTRHPTAAGTRFAGELAAGLTERGGVIVSGLALGIDAAAHQGALDAGGVTVAVLGCGIAHDHPKRNRALRRRIARTGAVLSEYWLDTEPAPWRFPARNRIVAGLAHVTVVVEARGRSGALITADFALEVGRVALAVPGHPWAGNSQGCNDLIRAGAGVCCGVDDVIAELPHPGWITPSAEAVARVPEGPCAVVYEVLRREPRRLDELTATTRLTAAETAAALAQLEITGLVVRGEGQRYWATTTAA